MKEESVGRTGFCIKKKIILDVVKKSYFTQKLILLILKIRNNLM